MLREGNCDMKMQLGPRGTSVVLFSLGERLTG